MTLYLTKVDDPRAFGCVPTDADGRVTAFLEKDPNPVTDQINAGHLCLPRDGRRRRSRPGGRSRSSARRSPGCWRGGARVVGHRRRQRTGATSARRRTSSPGSADLVRVIAPSPALPGPTGESLVLAGRRSTRRAALSGGSTVGAAASWARRGGRRRGAVRRRRGRRWGGGAPVGARVRRGHRRGRGARGRRDRRPRRRSATGVELLAGARVWPDVVLPTGASASPPTCDALDAIGSGTPGARSTCGATLWPLRRGAGDPAHRLDARRRVLVGVRDARRRRDARGAAPAMAWSTARAWGPGATGCSTGCRPCSARDDDWSALDLVGASASARRRASPAGDAAAGDRPGARFARARPCSSNASPATTRGVRGALLLRRFGSPAPGPAADLRVPPSARDLLDITTWDWHRLGVDARRQRAIRAAATVAPRLEECVGAATPSPRWLGCACCPASASGPPPRRRSARSASRRGQCRRLSHQGSGRALPDRPGARRRRRDAATARAVGRSAPARRAPDRGCPASASPGSARASHRVDIRAM